MSISPQKYKNNKGVTLTELRNSAKSSPMEIKVLKIPMRVLQISDKIG